MMRRIVVALLVSGVVALGLAAHEAVAYEDASTPAVMCPRTDRFVKLEFGEWGGAETAIPRERFALAGSDGANRPGGFMIFGSATATRADTDRACRQTRVLPNPSRKRLSKPIRYRRTGSGNTYFVGSDGSILFGEAFCCPGEITDPRVARRASGVSFRCSVSAPVTVLIVDSRDRAGRVVGTVLTARVGREMLATAVLRKRGDSFFRVSRRCEQG